MEEAECNVSPGRLVRSRRVVSNGALGEDHTELGVSSEEDCGTEEKNSNPQKNRDLQL